MDLSDKRGKYSMNISDIQPSQLFLCREKIQLVSNEIDENPEIGPVPVKTIGGVTFFTDGHTRAFVLKKRGIGEIEVCHDNDELDWLSYLICIKWCMENKIFKIDDLGDRILDTEKYSSKWLSLCAEMQRDVRNDPRSFVSIKEISDDMEKRKHCLDILHELGEWFGIESAVMEYADGVADTIFFTACIGNIPVGFISLKEHNKYCSEIYVTGIYKELQNRGIGKMLVNHSCDMLREKNSLFLTVKTLGPSHPDENYRRTRNFYAGAGFYPLEELKNHWGNANPCLLMIKPISK